MHRPIRELLFKDLRLFLGTVVHPDDCVAQRSPLSVYRKKRFALSGNAQRRDLLTGKPGFLQAFAQTRFESVPIDFKLLLHHQRRRCDQGVLLRGVALLFPHFIKDRNLYCRCSKIDTK